MFIRLVSFVLGLTVLTVMPSPANAALAFHDPVVLPIKTASATLLLADRGQLLIAGWQDEVTVVDLGSGALTQVPGTVGMGTLSTSADGTKVIGATKTLGELVELDLETMTTRRWGVGGCTSDAVTRRDGIYFIASGTASCGQMTSLRRFDPSSGETLDVTPNTHYQHPTLVALPALDRFALVESGTSSPDAWVFDIDSMGQTSVVGHRGDTGGPAFMTDEGGQLVVSGSVLSLPDLALLETLPIPATQVSSNVVVGAAYDGLAVVNRADGRLLNSYHGFEEEYYEPFGQAIVVGTTLYAVENSPYRNSVLYVEPNATNSAPVIAFPSVEPKSIYLGEPANLSGQLTFLGDPVADATVALTLRTPGLPDESLGTATTNAAGAWTFELTPPTTGFHSIAATYTRDARDTIAYNSLYVRRRPSYVDLSATPEVPGEGTIHVEGRLLDEDLQPLRGEPVRLQHSCDNPSSDPINVDLSTDSSGVFAFDMTAGACYSYYFRADYGGNDFREPAWDWYDSRVNRLPSRIWISPAPDEVLPGGSSTVTIRTTDLNNVSLPGVTVELTRTTPQGIETVSHPTTDDTGTYSFVETAMLEGTYYYEAEWGGTAKYAGWFSQRGVTVRKTATALTAAAPSSTLIHEPFTMTGQLTGAPLPAALSVLTPEGLTESVMTDGNGDYTVSGSSSSSGYKTWRISYAGDETHAASQLWRTVRIDKFPTFLNAIAPETGMGGESFDLAGRLEGIETPVAIAIAGPGGPSTVMTDESGGFSTPITPTSTGSRTWVLSYPGDERHAAATTSVTVQVSPRPVSLTLKAPASIPAGETFQISGQASEINSGYVTVTDPDGSQEQIPISADGMFTFPAFRPMPGFATWHVEFVSHNTFYTGATATARVGIQGTPTPHIASDHAFYGSGDNARIVVTPGSESGGFVVVTAARADGVKRVLFQGQAPAAGLTLSRSMRHNETLQVVVPATALTVRATARVRAFVGLSLTSTPLLPTALRGDVAIYRHGLAPQIRTTSRVARPGTCVRYRVNRWVDDRWVDRGTSACLTQSANGVALWKWTGRHDAGSRFRLWAEFPGDVLNVFSMGKPIFVRFT